MMENDKLLIENMMFMDAALDGSKIWFTNGDTGELYSYNIDNYTLFFYGIYEELAFVARKVFMKGNTLYFVSTNGFKIVELIIGNWKLYVRQKCEGDLCNTGIKNAYLYDNKILVLPTNVDSPICLFDTINKEIAYKKMNISTEFSNQKYDFVDFYESEIYFTLSNTKWIFKYNHYTDKVIPIYKGEKLELKGLCVVNDSIWLLEGTELVKYDINVKQSKSYNFSPDFVKTGYDGNRKIVVCGEKLVLLPYTDNNIYIIDVNSLMVSKVDLCDEFSRKKNCERATYTIGLELIGNTLFIYPWAGRTMAQIDVNDNKLIARKFVLYGNDCYRYIKEKRLKSILMESEDVDVSLFLKCINVEN